MHSWVPAHLPFVCHCWACSCLCPTKKMGLSGMLYGVSELDLLCSVFYVSSLIFGSFVFQEWCFHLVSCHEKLGLPINLEPPTGTLAGILSYCLPPSLWLPLPLAYFWDYLIQPKFLFELVCTHWQNMASSTRKCFFPFNQTDLRSPNMHLTVFPNIGLSLPRTILAKTIISWDNISRGPSLNLVNFPDGQ